MQCLLALFREINISETCKWKFSKIVEVWSTGQKSLEKKSLGTALSFRFPRLFTGKRLRKGTQRHLQSCAHWAYLISRDQWFLQHFTISMCGIKFWKGNKNLKSVHKKMFFEILSGFFSIFDLFSSSIRFIAPSKRWKLFFFE